MVKEFCHILFEKTTMCAYQNIALVMISAKSEQITSIHGYTPGRKKRIGWWRRWPNSSQCALPGFQAVPGHAEGSTHLCAPPPPPTPASPFSHSDLAYPSDERGQHICAQIIHRGSLHIYQWHTTVFPNNYFFWHEPINHFSDFISSIDI